MLSCTGSSARPRKGKSGVVHAAPLSGAPSEPADASEVPDTQGIVNAGSPGSPSSPMQTGDVEEEVNI